ncbi:SDR family NAD(P)-dependent oxidoreductase [Vibrio genomosp. F6]|uniref:Short chain dehydrogenase n=1 Tax=Vibrio genomosp. F6 str. FF-238 TaxID=1191298 RepID=A0A1E5D0Y2_9VIBR|nr:SDR family NAD(P)-dependent oxidoreductase [Vibrio genomosp. F6]OEE77041.1 short chain dehydrogenase [Vibrio genomosp. F6 str. FF-238]RBW67128.1 SDR family NAD(P)-dependent oxidoreductase [Vibrionales bacterium C3R12]
MKILIIGGNGGIGQAITRYVRDTFPTAKIFATYRSTLPEDEGVDITWLKVNASLDADVKHLAEQISNLDMLINTAGFLHDVANKPEKSINDFTPEFFNQNLSSNTLPTLLLAKYFSNHLKAKHQTYFISLSARIGSIKDNQIGGWVSYRCSKAALNMAVKTVSIEWQFKLPNCCVVAFHPGTTDTNLSQPFQKNVPPNKLFTTEYVSQQLFKIISKVQPSDTGKFYSFTGEELPW